MTELSSMYNYLKGMSEKQTSDLVLSKYGLRINTYFNSIALRTQIKVCLFKFKWEIGLDNLFHKFAY